MSISPPFSPFSTLFGSVQNTKLPERCISFTLARPGSMLFTSPPKVLAIDQMDTVKPSLG